MYIICVSLRSEKYIETLATIKAEFVLFLRIDLRFAEEYLLQVKKL